MLRDLCIKISSGRGGVLPRPRPAATPSRAEGEELKGHMFICNLFNITYSTFIALSSNLYHSLVAIIKLLIINY